MTTMAERRTALLLVGVGGQGVLTAARILGDAALGAGLEVTVGQLHGMSQRGGSVSCTVQIGPGKSSWIVDHVDVLVAFEPLEALRALPSVGKGTRVVMNLGTISPPAVLAGAADYPSCEDIVTQMKSAASSVTLIDGPTLVEEVGEARTLNTIMLGALAGLGLLPFDGSILSDAANRKLPIRYQDRNRQAFDLGLAEVTARSDAKHHRST